MATTEGAAAAKRKTKCGRCGKNARLQGIEYCNRCLNRIIEKRVKNSLKAATEGLHKVNGKQRRLARKLIIVCEERRSLACASALYLTKKLLGAASSLSITVEKQIAKPPSSAAPPKKTDYGRVEGTILIYPQCSDDLAVGLIRKFISSPRNEQQSGTSNRHINIFDSITEKELQLYAGMKKIKYAQKHEDGLKQAIQKLQERYPGTIEAIARSAARLSQICAEGKK